MRVSRPEGWKLSVVCAAAVLAGCASHTRMPAPVEDRSGGRPAPAPVVVEPSRNAPGVENAGRPGYYTVRPGDTLIRIALDAGQNWRDIARWNSLDNPNVIEVGQVLRVVPPVVAIAQAPRPVAPAPSAPSAVTSTAPVVPPAVQGPASAASAASPASSAPPPVASGPAPSPQPAVPAEDDVPWAWPVASGGVLAGFDDQRNKGLDISGKAGEPVLAAGDGRVVYAGAGLRGYGNLIILKHNNTYLSAYAHNQVLLVKEDQTVRKGQKIAEMGSSDADRVKLHFEIRRQGRPVDPARYLPAR